VRQYTVGYPSDSLASCFTVRIRLTQLYKLYSPKSVAQIHKQ